MSKKIDIKRTLGKTITPLSIETVEEMTRKIHDKKAEIMVPVEPIVEAPQAEPEPTAVSKQAANYEKTTAKPEKGKAGRKPKLIQEEERLLRVSVDLPESVFIQLKVLVIQQKTDLKTYIRKLVEKEMEKLAK